MNQKKTSTKQVKEISSNDEDDQDYVVSKTATKKALHDILLFGETLLALSPKKLSTLPLSDLLLAEIELARKLKVDNSRRRQIQRIAKILRSENIEEIQTAHNEQEEKNRQHHLSGNPSEKWCEQLIEKPEALADFVNRFPNVNRQQLGQLIRNAKKERKISSSSEKNQQRLFKLIQEALLSQDTSKKLG